ncbi:MAG TPA: VRR-NUC domain-containing protein [Pyrinomonadaceae bacterium]|jgi:hypothetical protein
MASRRNNQRVEAGISSAIREYLDARRIYNVRVNSGKVRGPSGSWIHLAPAGTPDRLACYRGRFIAIEVKKPGEEPSLEQLEKHVEIRRNGGIVIVAESVDDVIKAIGSIE